jgi:hypothetical protein
MVGESNPPERRVPDSTETSSTPAPDLPQASRRFVMASRMLLLVLAFGAVAAGAFIALQGGKTARPGIEYVCPMHPEVRAPDRGSCPICHMALEPVARGPAASARAPDAPGVVDTTAVDNVRKHKIIDFARKRSLLFDTRDLRAPAAVGADGVVTALYYQDQIDALAVGEQGTFSPAAAPDSRFPVRRTADVPVTWDRSTSRVRFRVERSGAKRGPAPGQAGWVEVPRKAREVLTVPASAVLQSPQGPYVLTPTGPYSFAKRNIEIGETFAKQGVVVVLSGLRVHEAVVSRATFFVDAERRLGADAAAEEWSSP